MTGRTLTTQIVVRVDTDLRARLEADAEANERTVAQSVRFLLRQALADRVPRRPAPPRRRNPSDPR